MTHVDLSRLRTDGGWSKKRRSLRLIHLFIYQINIVECVCITVAVWNCWFGSPRCRNLHTCGCFWCNYLQSPPPPSSVAQKPQPAATLISTSCWKVFLQALATSDLATIRCPGSPSWFALQSQRRVLIHEGHKPSVSREGARSRCHVLLPRVVCLQEGATWPCVWVCVRVCVCVCR